MELFDTHFVYFSQVLAVSGLKMLVTSDGHQIMNAHTKWNCLIPILSTLVKYKW